MLAAVALAASDEPGDTKASRKRAVKAAVDEVAGYLGNTPTDRASNSYVDPRVIDHYETGRHHRVHPARYRRPERRQAAIEKAVLALLAAD